ncbi:MAG: flagellar motor switch protein FliN [Gammaproteobacteria bacterium]|nr:flagellar motor switch protein FliN [Gammaproteobacteria bacterium]
MSDFEMPTTDGPTLDDAVAGNAAQAANPAAAINGEPYQSANSGPKDGFESNPAPRSGGNGNDFLGNAIAQNRGNGKNLHNDIQEAHIEVIMDVPVTLSLEIGRTRITIRDLLQLNPGSVVKLERMAGEPMDIMVNGCLVAKGEVVTVGEKFGVRIAEVVSPEERIRSLK